MKRLLPFLIAFLSAVSLMAQTNSYKWLELKNVDTTAFTNSDGRFWYNPTVHKFTFMENGAVKHIGSGTGGLVSFTSGNLSPLFTTSLGGSPTTAPALTFTLTTQSANLVFAGPTSGGAVAPTFRSLVAADIPSLSYATNTAANNEIPKSNGSTGLGTSSIFSTSAGNLILGSSGASGSHSISAASSDTNTDLSLSPQAAGNIIINGNQTVIAGTNNLNLRSSSGNTVYIGHVTANNDLYVTQDIVLNRTILGRRNAGGILQVQSNASTVSSGVTGSILFDITAPTGGGTYGNYAYNVAALPSFGGGEKVFFYGPAITNPSTAVSSGGVFFVKSSDNLPYWRTASTEYSMTGAGSGSVTSVGSLSPLFTTSNATTTPTFTAVNQNANLVYGGPGSGGAAAPTFRALVAADIPALSYDVLLAPTAVKTSNYTAAVGELVKCDITTGFTVTLPTAPTDGKNILIKIVAPSVPSNTLTIAAGGSDVFNVSGGSTTLSLTRKFQSVWLQYQSSGAIWIVKTTDDAIGTWPGSSNLTTVASNINLPGNPTTTSQTPGNNSTRIATTHYVDTLTFLTNGNFIVGSASNVATGVAASGVVALNNAGAFSFPTERWKTNGTTLMDGIGTITSNAPVQHLFNGTYTGTGDNQYHMAINPVITTVNTTSITDGILVIGGSITAGAASQTLAALDIQTTMSTTNSPTNFKFRAQGVNGNFTIDRLGTATFALGTTTSAPAKQLAGTLLTSPVAFASENNSSSSYLTKNSGLRFGVGGEIFEAFADVGNTSTTETDIHTYTTPVSTFAENGEKIRAQYNGIFVSSATATRQLKVYFGGTAIFDSGALSNAASSSWTVNVTLIRVSSTVIRYSVALQADGVTITSPIGVGELTGLTLSNTNILKITGTAASTGAATNDIVLKFATGQWRPTSHN